MMLQVRTTSSHGFRTLAVSGVWRLPLPAVSLLVDGTEVFRRAGYSHRAGQLGDGQFSEGQLACEADITLPTMRRKSVVTTGFAQYPL
jgi:hypothetical protein